MLDKYDVYLHGTLTECLSHELSTLYCNGCIIEIEHIFHLIDPVTEEYKIRKYKNEYVKFRRKTCKN